MNFKQFLAKANTILESQGQDLRNKHGLDPGEVSARLAKRSYKKIEDDETTPDDPLDKPYQNLHDRASNRAQGKPNAEFGIRSRGGGAGSGSERDRGNIPKPERLQQWVDGKRTSPNMTADERKRAHRR
jgi:hypothetical protein